MAEKNQGKENKNLKVALVIGWLFFVGILVGRTIGILLTHDDVSGIGEFFERLAVWDFFYILIFVLLIVGSIKVFKKEN